MKFLFCFLMLFAFVFFNTKAQVQIGQDIDDGFIGKQTGKSVSMPDKNTIAIGEGTDALPEFFKGAVRIYYRDSFTGNWVQKGATIFGEGSNNLGFSVSMPDANTVAVGAPGSSQCCSSPGFVKVFAWNGVDWVQKGTTIMGVQTGAETGRSVSMPDENTLAIGTPFRYPGGRVDIYFWNGADWIKKGNDIVGGAYDACGFTLIMPDSNTIAIGSPYNDGPSGISDNSGLVKIYVWNGSSWIQKGTSLYGENVNDSYKFGFQLSMPDSNNLAIGAYDYSGNGVSYPVRIYNWKGFNWEQKGAAISRGYDNEQESISISMPDSNTIAIGDPLNSENGQNAGKVRVFFWNGFNWIQKGLDIYGEKVDDRSGSAVSMPDAKTVAIGSPLHGSYYNGQVRVFSLIGAVGGIYNDINENCLKENEPGLINRRAAINPGNFVVETNSEGFWHLDSIPAGNYTITIDTSGKWLPTCNSTQNFSVLDPNGIIIVPSFGLISTEPCPSPQISIYYDRMRPGFSNQKIYVNTCNDNIATGALGSAYADIVLDKMLTVNYAYQYYVNLGNNKYRFYLNNLNPGQCKAFNISTTLSTNAVLGQSLCVQANLFPADSCVFDTLPAPTPPDFTPCNLPWDKSSLKVQGWCQNDSIYFTVTNHGSGDMDCYAPVRVYIDGQYISLDSVQLLSGQTATFAFAGDGRTWHLEADQHPLHPGNSHPNATIELCGDSFNFTSGLVNVLPLDDADPVVDIYCGVVTGSYDPNDKTGYPLGLTTEHLIEPNQKIEYKIRFQNTGNDTAFTVVVRDTLDTDLDIFSVRSGVASHAYTFRMYGSRILEWTFNSIMLTDSSTNEAKSHGFVCFEVNQNKDLADGTLITNHADIYFDFNSPIITNTTSHKISRNVKLPAYSQTKSLSLNGCDTVFYNGYQYTTAGNYYNLMDGGINPDTLCLLNVSLKQSSSLQLSATECDSYTAPDGQIYTTSGIKKAYYTNAIGCDSVVTINLTINTTDESVTQNDAELTANATNGNYQWLDCLDNYAAINGENNQTFAPAQNGSYALQVMQNNCIDTSACFDITTVGILENTLSKEMQVFPNPTKGNVSISLGSIYELVTVKLSDAKGAVLSKKEYTNTALIELSINAAPGVYFIEVSDSNSKKALVRVVKE